MEYNVGMLDNYCCLKYYRGLNFEKLIGTNQ